MPRHTSRLSGHPSILDAVINYRGARRSGIISGISLSGQRRGFIEDGLSNPSIPDGGIDLFSRNGYLLWGVSSSPGNVKLKLSFEGNQERDRNEPRRGTFCARYPVTIVEGADFKKKHRAGKFFILKIPRFLFFLRKPRLNIYGVYEFSNLILPKEI